MTLPRWGMVAVVATAALAAFWLLGKLAPLLILAALGYALWRCRAQVRAWWVKLVTAGRARLAGVTIMQWQAMERRADETRIVGDTVARALAMDTVEADVQLANQRAAFNDRIEQLMLVPKRTRPQELEFVQLNRFVRDIDARMGGGTLLERRLSEFGDVGQKKGLLATFASGMVDRTMMFIAAGAGVLALAGFGYGQVQAARAERLETERDEAARIADENAAAARDWRAQYEQAHNDAIEAQQQAAATAETIERERRRRTQAERERRRIRDAVEQAVIGGPIDYGFGGVRPSGDREGAGADSGDAGSGDPG